MNNEIEFQLEGFSGPLDLLLHLSKEKEIELTNLSLDSLIDQYLDFIEKVQENGLNIRSNYLEMAAELIRLKSVSILNYNTSLELELEDDELIGFDREEIINRLLEYKKYKEITSKFSELIDKRDNFIAKKPDSLKEFREDNFINNLDINDLILATQNYLNNIKKEEKSTKIINSHEIDLETYMIQLQNLDHNINFYKHLDSLTKINIISFFLAILEALKLQYISINYIDEELNITPYKEENYEL